MSEGRDLMSYYRRTFDRPDVRGKLKAVVQFNMLNKKMKKAARNMKEHKDELSGQEDSNSKDSQHEENNHKVGQDDEINIKHSQGEGINSKDAQDEFKPYNEEDKKIQNPIVTSQKVDQIEEKETIPQILQSPNKSKDEKILNNKVDLPRIDEIDRDDQPHLQVSDKINIEKEKLESSHQKDDDIANKELDANRRMPEESSPSSHSHKGNEKSTDQAIIIAKDSEVRPVSTLTGDSVDRRSTPEGDTHKEATPKPNTTTDHFNHPVEGDDTKLEPLGSTARNDDTARVSGQNKDEEFGLGRQNDNIIANNDGDQRGGTTTNPLLSTERNEATDLEMQEISKLSPSSDSGKIKTEEIGSLRGATNDQENKVNSSLQGSMRNDNLGSYNHDNSGPYKKIQDEERKRTIDLNESALKEQHLKKLALDAKQKSSRRSSMTEDESFDFNKFKHLKINDSERGRSPNQDKAEKFQTRDHNQGISKDYVSDSDNKSHVQSLTTAYTSLSPFNNYASHSTGHEQYNTPTLGGIQEIEENGDDEGDIEELVRNIVNRVREDNSRPDISRRWGNEYSQDENLNLRIGRTREGSISQINQEESPRGVIGRTREGSISQIKQDESPNSIIGPNLRSFYENEASPDIRSSIRHEDDRIQLYDVHNDYLPKRMHNRTQPKSKQNTRSDNRNTEFGESLADHFEGVTIPTTLLGTRYEDGYSEDHDNYHQPHVSEIEQTSRTIRETVDDIGVIDFEEFLSRKNRGGYPDIISTYRTRQELSPDPYPLERLPETDDNFRSIREFNHRQQMFRQEEDFNLIYSSNNDDHLRTYTERTDVDNPSSAFRTIMDDIRRTGESRSPRYDTFSEGIL